MKGNLHNESICHSRLRNVASALALGIASVTLPFAVATPAHAQVVNASLRGKITVEGGASQVTAIDVNSGIMRSTPVGADGSYNFASLRPGTYRLEITTPAGVRRTDEITLQVAQNAILDIDLAEPPPETAEPGAPPSDRDIVVVGQRLRSMEGGEVGANISQRLIETLPQTNRNFLAFADLAPGVQFFTGANQQSRVQGGAQDSRTVNVFIDGVGQKDYVLKNGVTGQDSTRGNPFPQLAVGQYRVITSNYKAEFDQVSSVAITAVTKSGTNEFHGEGFIDYSNQDLRKKTHLEEFTGKLESKDIQYGGALSGPIIKDKLHFFVTYEGKRFEQPRDIFPGSADNVENIPAEFQSQFGTTLETFNENLYFGKIDFVPTDKDLFEASVKHRKETGEAINSGSNLVSNSINNLVDETRGVLRWERTEDRWINDLKFTYEDARWAPTPVVFENAFQFQDAMGRNIFRSGGGANFQDKGQKGWAIQNDFTWIGLDKHTIKAGVKAKWVKLKTLQLNMFNPVFFFNTQFMGGPWNDTIPYRVQFGFDSGLGGDPEVTSKNFQLGLYIQDDWEVTDRLNLYLGLRWDYDRTPAWVDFVTTQASLDAVSPANYPNLINADYDINDYITDGNDRKTFKGAFQPRIGFDWELDSAARWILFGGYGRSYDRNQFDFLQQETQVGSFSTRTFNFQNAGAPPGQACAPSPTCVPWDPIYLTPEGRAALVASVGALGGSELRFINNKLKVPYSDQFSLGLRHRLNALMEAEVGYTHVESKDGFVWLLGNRRPDGSFFLPPPTNQGSPFGNPPPGRGSIILGDNGLETSADSVYLKFTKAYSASSRWSLNATYTYTEAEENRQFGETFSLDFPSIEDYPVLRSSGVPRHRLVAAGSVDLPYDFILAGKLTLQSPLYVKGFFNQAGTGFRQIRVIEGNNKQPFIIGDLWALRQIDLSLTKNFKLPFINSGTRVWARVDVLNVLNERNYTQYNSNATDDSGPDLLNDDNELVGDVNPTTGAPINNSNGRFGDINSLTMGGNPPRTFKFSLGFSF